MTETSEQRVTPEIVESAAQFLDREQPDWAPKVDLALLDMSRTDTCVLGQVCGGFYAGMDEMHHAGSWSHLEAFSPDIDEDDPRWKYLNRLWKRAVKARIDA